MCCKFYLRFNGCNLKQKLLIKSYLNNLIKYYYDFMHLPENKISMLKNVSANT